MSATKRYRIGVDVGGTNTDAVLLSLNPIEVAASHKTPTTEDVTSGITIAIRAVIAKSIIQLEDIECVIIGTTHFVNAVVQRSSKLRKVAVVRLSGGKTYGSRVPAFVDFPQDLKQLLSTRLFFCKGGFQIDGSEISAIDHDEIKDVARQLSKESITDVVVAGIYSPLNASQEDKVADLLIQNMGDEFAAMSPPRHTKVRVTKSHEISSLGFLARENAAILNASLRPMAEHTIRGFQKSMDTIFQGLPCSLYLTQNDGSVLSAQQAISLPIRTFNSGPTNSIRGGAFLWRAAATLAAKSNGNIESNEPAEALVVLDIGGTTSDAGLLLSNGLPRMSSVASIVGGVRTNFGLPAVESVGLGGGSIVRQLDDGKVTVGPDSVGFEIQTKAKVFGGSVITATDIVMATFEAIGSKTGLIAVGDPSKAAGINPKTIRGAQMCIKELVENLIDRAKIEKNDIDVLIVGGGALVVDPDQPLKGVKRCRTVIGGEVANAVGAAISQVEGMSDMVMDLSGMTSREAQEIVKAAAIESAQKNGASHGSIEIAEVTILPVQYMQGKARIIVRAIGELDIVQTNTSINGYDDEDVETLAVPTPTAGGQETLDQGLPMDLPVSLKDYRPLIKDKEWIVSIIDLELIAIGCKILGCGGGGDPYVEYLQTKTRLSKFPGSVRVIDPSSLSDTSIIGWSSNMGSPEVSAERMEANECYLAQLELMKFMNIEKLDGMISLEIGGANGLVNFSVGADLNVPIVDGDYMGRAYPTYWQTTANVDDKTGSGSNLVPACINSGDGTSIIMSSTKSDKLVDRALRAACVEMGSRAGKAANPQSGAKVKAQAVLRTVSLAWRIGRAVKMEKNVSQLTDRIIEAVGGPTTAKKVFEGRIVGVERMLMKGHTYGICEIEGVSFEGQKGSCKIPFKNENAFVEMEGSGGTRKILVSVPDLIEVLDAETGQGLGIQEYRYGLKVNVICIAASPRWTETARGLELGGPGAMGFEDVTYTPQGVYCQPRSVIEEFGPD